jgi:uncharacterized protein YjbJ (UPF0337 family)
MSTDNTKSQDILARDGIANAVKGAATDIKGKIKDAAGGLTGRPGLQVEGKIDQAVGITQKEFGKAELHASKAIHDADAAETKDEKVTEKNAKRDADRTA